MKPSFDEIYMSLAINLANRSHCVKAQVGAVLVKDTRIISLGYNGPPSGTHNCDEEWPLTGCERDRKGGCSLAIHAEEKDQFDVTITASNRCGKVETTFNIQIDSED